MNQNLLAAQWYRLGRRLACVLLAAAGLFAVGSALFADEENGGVQIESDLPKPGEGRDTPDLPKGLTDRPDPATPDPAGLTRVAEGNDVWIDPKRKLVVVDGEVCLRERELVTKLEMFACPKGSKEHEALVAVNAKSHVVHAALLAVGAKPGQAVRFQPEYVPASGMEVEVLVLWRDAEGKQQKARAQDWIRHIKTGKVMEQNWVFGGSYFTVDPDTREQTYAADVGDLICVSNFPSAMLDLPIRSSQDTADLEFEAFLDRVPKLGTKVRLVLVPKIEK